MRRTLVHSVTAWLCLVAFGVCNTLLAGGVVVCRCTENAHVALIGAHIYEGNDCHAFDAAHSPKSHNQADSGICASCHNPCDDSPISNHAPAAARASKVTSCLIAEPAPLPSQFAIAAVWHTLSEPISRGCLREWNAPPPRPSGELTGLRTIVINV